jgi:hypothetical protein
MANRLRILAVGWLGFIGSDLVRYILDKYDKVKVIKNGIKAVLRRYAIYKVRREASKCSGVEDYVDLVITFHKRLSLFPPKVCDMFSISPAQVKEEIKELSKILAKCKPRFSLEIGTAKGGTLFPFARISSSDAKIISVDFLGDRFGGGYPEWRIPLYKSFGIHKQRLHFYS